MKFKLVLVFLGVATLSNQLYAKQNAVMDVDSVTNPLINGAGL